MAAQDLERLVVQLSADIRRYENAINRANNISNKRFRNIEKRAQSMSKTVNSSFTRMAQFIGGAAMLRSSQLLIDASTRIQNSLKVAGLEGDGLTKVYDALYASAQRNAAPIESLVTLYGRAALVQKELGVSTEELLKFTDNVALALRVAGTDAQTASGALLQLSQALGSGTVRAEEFNSILEGALPIAQATAAGLKETGGSVAKLRQLVVDGKLSSEAFFRAFEAGSVILEGKVANAQLTVAQGFVLIQNALVDAAGKVNAGTQAGQELAEALGMIADAIKDSDFTPLISGLATFIKDVRIAINDIKALYAAIQNSDWSGAAKAMGFGRSAEDYERLRNPNFGLTENEIARSKAAENLRKAFANASSQGVKSGIVDQENARVNQAFSAFATKQVSLKDFKAPDSSKDKDGAKKQREDTWQREKRQIEEQTRALEQELLLVGKSEQAKDKMRATMELENAARRAGVELTDTNKRKISELADAYSVAAERVREAETRFEAINALQQEFGQLAGDGILGLIDGTKTLNDVLSETLKRLAEMAMQAALLGEGPFGNLFGLSGSGGKTGGLFGAIGKMMGFSGGGYTGDGGKHQPAGVVHKGEYVFDKAAVRAAGGPEALEAMRRGLKGYASGGLVGGAMPAMPRIPTPSELKPASAGNISVNYAPVIDARGASPDVVPMIEAAMQAQEKRFMSSLPARIKDAQRRGQLR